MNELEEMVSRGFQNYAKDFLSSCEPDNIATLSEQVVDSYITDVINLNLSKTIINTLISATSFGLTFMLDNDSLWNLPLTILFAYFSFKAMNHIKVIQSIRRNEGFLSEIAPRIVRKYYLVDQYNK